MQGKQLPLFPPPGAPGERTPLPSPAVELTSKSSLAAAIGMFHGYMLRRGFSENTIKSFLSDLRLLGKYIGQTTPLYKIQTKNLEDFLTYLLEGRGVPCNAKSYSRRVTTLKVFFAWLAEIEVLRHDPAAAIIHQRASTPLPEVLYPAQIERLMEAGRRLMNDPDKPDARPYLLVSLILHTGIKKSECMNIALDHIDLSDVQHPVLYVRYDNAKSRHKERKLRLPTDFPAVLEKYRAQYQPRVRLFECTARNLEYVLTGLGQLAGLDDISFEKLRMTCAVRDFQSGMPAETLRQKLGLSEITWAETGEKIRQLAAAPL